MVLRPTHPSLASECVVLNDSNVPFEEFTCIYPFLKNIYTDFEMKYDPVAIRDWMREHPVVPIVAVILYLIFIFGGQKYMSARKPFHFRGTMAAWNLFLSLFSVIGFTRTAPHLIHNLYHFSLRDNVCKDPESQFGCGSTGFWVQLFVLSKFPELFDTFFLVVHKKPVILLHWWHHISVLALCWHLYVTSAPNALIFVVMNYGVHAIMYFYYFLMAIRQKPKWLNAMVITVLQLSQMVVGVAVGVTSFYYFQLDSQYRQDHPPPNATDVLSTAEGFNNGFGSQTERLGDDDVYCWITREANWGASMIYGSYLLLFGQFFLRRYFAKAKTTTTTTNGTTKNKTE